MNRYMEATVTPVGCVSFRSFLESKNCLEQLERRSLILYDSLYYHLLTEPIAFYSIGFFLLAVMGDDLKKMFRKRCDVFLRSAAKLKSGEWSGELPSI